MAKRSFKVLNKTEEKGSGSLEEKVIPDTVETEALGQYSLDIIRSNLPGNAFEKQIRSKKRKNLTFGTQEAETLENFIDYVKKIEDIADDNLGRNHHSRYRMEFQNGFEIEGEGTLEIIPKNMRRMKVKGFSYDTFVHEKGKPENEKYIIFMGYQGNEKESSYGKIYVAIEPSHPKSTNPKKMTQTITSGSPGTANPAVLEKYVQFGIDVEELGFKSHMDLKNKEKSWKKPWTLFK